MKVQIRKELFCLGIIVIMFIITLVSYNSIPQQIPVHWNIKGEADSYLPKNPFSASLMPLLALGLWILFLILPNIDPRKEKYEKFYGVYQIIKNSLILFLFLLQIVLTANWTGHSLPVEKFVPAGISILFIILGNFMGKIRQNYFVGIKLPWTIENEDVWNKTHRFSGKIWVIGGIVAFISVFFNSTITATVFSVCLVLMLLLPILYSYSIYQKVK
ncbi:MAG: SdpI family protein [Chitinispirillaceae bacterium]|nr:SdpI family protein [Chitinispirillaceae bacterium]